MLEAYERLVPGSAKRIVDWSDIDIRHAHAMEKVVLEAVTTERRRGQVCAVVVCAVACATAGYCAHMGATLAASIIGGSTIVGVVAAFLGSRWGGGSR